MKKNNFFSGCIALISVVVIIATIIVGKNIWYGPKIDQLDSKELKEISTVLEKATEKLPRNKNEEVNVKTIVIEYRDPENNNRENVEVKIENGQVTQKRVKNENYKPDTMVAILETYVRIVAIIVIGSIVIVLLFLLVRYKTPKMIRKWEVREEKKKERNTVI